MGESMKASKHVKRHSGSVDGRRAWYGRCVISQQLIDWHSTFPGDSFEQVRRCRMHVVHKVRNRGLADPYPLRECGLSRASALEVLGKGFHMSSESIRLPYTSAIGSPYGQLQHNLDMSKSERSFLDRALEALAERYPREKPTQVRLAKMAGVSQPAAHEWGWPDRAPEHRIVLKLAKELDVCVEWLYTERGPKRPPNAPGDPFLKDWNDLTPDAKRQIETFAGYIRNNSPKRQ